MGAPKAALPYGPSTLLAHQTSRLATMFTEVLAVVKEAPSFDAGPARVILDGPSVTAPIYGLAAALDLVEDRVFILAVDLPLLSTAVIEKIAVRSLGTDASVVVPRAEGRLQPLAAVWRRRVRTLLRDRLGRGELSLWALALESGAEILEPEEWLPLDPSGNSFANVNTVAQYTVARERG